jgi:prolyl oligopeptidase
MPGRAALIARMKEAEDSAAARVPLVTRLRNGMVFFLRQDPGHDQPRLYVRTSLAGTDRLLIDPERLRKDQSRPVAILAFFPSPGGKYVAYTVAESGSEKGFLHVLELRSGREMIEPIANAESNGQSVEKWLPDETGFYFVTYRDPASVAKSDQYTWSQTWFLPLQDAKPDATPVIDGMTGIGPKLGPLDQAFILFPVRSARPLIFSWEGTRPEIRLLTASSIRRGTETKWIEIVSRDDAIVQDTVAGDQLYLRTHKGAPRFKVISTSFSHPDVAHGIEVLPEGRGVITAIAAAQDALYATIREGNRVRLVAVGHASHRLHEIELPFPGNVRILTNNAQVPGVLIELGNWVRTSQIYQADMKSGRATPTSLQPAGKFDVIPNVEVTLLSIPSHDGVEVPLSVIHRARLRLDGNNVTILTGYGAYGFSQEPRLRLEWLPWLEKGGIQAVCHVRGGGEYGDPWYRAGWKATKSNTWKDYIACAEYLIKNGYTSPAKLGALGFSAGGITVGRALTTRPDLFAAVVPTVGVLDTLRIESDANGAPNVPEYGSVNVPADFPYLLEMSSYHHVSDGVSYPAVLLPHGVNDPRVPVWQSMKMAARLQAASSSGRPVLLDLDFEAGHGVGSGQAQRLGRFADSLAFMLWQFGDPAFRPQ